MIKTKIIVGAVAAIIGTTYGGNLEMIMNEW